MADKTVLLSRIAHLLSLHANELPLVQRLAEAGREILGVSGVSIIVEPGTQNRVTLWATDTTAGELDDLQDVLVEGPCWDAWATGLPQQTDLGPDADRQWPQFGPAARSAVGRRMVRCIPMRPRDQVLGVLSLHQPLSTELAEGMDTAVFLADTIGAALLTDPQARDEHAGPWSGRSRVHQATGMVIAQLRIPSGDALALLRAHAYAENTTLEAIADQVLTRRLDFRKDQ